MALFLAGPPTKWALRLTLAGSLSSRQHGAPTRMEHGSNPYTFPCSQYNYISWSGPPERVGNCVLVNLTVASLEVGCTAGNDGGLPQRFIARVYAAPTHTLLATLEEEHTPRFHVGGLTPGQDYLITVTAVNAKGTSLPQQIDAVRLKVAEKRMGEVSSPPVSPLVGVFLGLVGGFILLLLVGVLLSRARSNRCWCWGEREIESQVVTCSTSPLPTTTTPSSTHALSLHDDQCVAPDVLRTINGNILPLLTYMLSTHTDSLSSTAISRLTSLTPLPKSTATNTV
ncbi:uncharacterized protein [Cherax quadricarinatus]|uniref:uncharacterized protein n=1 Tax=Cherax quadricarinatus TaxID=27406 RepID=UPI00387E305F